VYFVPYRDKLSVSLCRFVPSIGLEDSQAHP
jgi:hypothetical protein